MTPMKSILENIKIAIDKINWQSETKKSKALEVCISIYNLYVYNGGDFYTFKSLSVKYFEEIIKTKKYVYEIKNSLIENSILEVNNSYNVSVGKGKGYRFTSLLVDGDYVTLCYPKELQPNNDVTLCYPKSTFQHIKISSNFQSFLNSFDSYHICYPTIESYIKQGLSKIEIKEEINDYISNYEIKRSEYKINSEIIEDYVNVVFDDGIYRYKLENAVKLSNELQLDLIEWKNKYYIENIDNFINRKNKELKLIFKKNIFDINNGIYRVSRNETNRRLDYNLTNMKSEILNYLTLEGEELIELDISNAQFAILSFISNDLDLEFIDKTQNGKLYNDNKQKWFRIAFDKIKKDQDDIRLQYPNTMKLIDSIKNNNGYKSFSNILQNAESLIMIDGLLNRLISLNYSVFPIHDAIRVKKSESNIIKNEIQKYFDEINFKCNVRNKSEKKTEIIRYKNFKDVEIDKVSTEDKKLFISKINELKELGFEPSEPILKDMNLFDEYKTWYLYDKWLKSEVINKK